MVPKNWDAEPEGHQREWDKNRNRILAEDECQPNQIGVWDPYQQVINELVALHNSKKHDYAQDDNQFSNFEASARYAGVSVEVSFNILIGTKIARLRNLRESGKDVMNETIEDTEFDLANYILIKKAYKLYKRYQDSARERARVTSEIDPSLSQAINAIDRGFGLPETYPEPSHNISMGRGHGVDPRIARGMDDPL